MLHIFRIENGVLREKDVDTILPSLAEDGSWIDLVDAEEDERIWCGSIFGLRVETVIVVETGNNYRKFFEAFLFLCDQA